MLWVTLGLITAVAVLIWVYSRYRHSYWQKQGVPVAPGYAPVFGHTLNMFSTSKFSWIFIDEIYKHHGGSTFCGVYEQFNPIMVIGDPDLIKGIMIKDFDHFVDRRNFTFTGKIDEYFQEMLTNATGSHWKGIRSVLSPSFSSGRMKGMFPLVMQKAEDLVRFINKKVTNNKPVKLKKDIGNYTLEVIASCAFGMDTSSLEEEDSVFAARVADLFKITTWGLVKTMFFLSFPKLCQALKINFSGEHVLFFRDVILDVMKQREAGHYRGDFLDLFMKARNEQKNPDSEQPKYTLTDKCIVSQSVLFILAGYDTTANTISFVTFLLAKHPEVQQRLRKELKEGVEEHGELTYQTVMEAKYLNACISETLRMYAPASNIERQCTKDYKIPGTEVVIPEGNLVRVPVYSLHHDERYWQDPMEFRPERFMPENKDDIKSGTYMPFGAGPRNCVGMRFALMETKLAIAKMLLEFNLSCHPGQEELELSKIPGLTRPSDDLSIAFTPLSEEGDLKKFN